MVANFKEEHRKILRNRERAKLLTVNSPTNHKQIKKESHKDFIEMVNSYSHIFDNLGTVLSGDLQRHFYKLYIKDEHKLREETLKIDLNFVKNSFKVMEVDFHKDLAKEQALFINQLVETLGLNLEEFSIYFGLNHKEINKQLTNVQSNALEKLRLKSTGLEIIFFTWSQLRKKIFPVLDQEQPYFNIAKDKIEKSYKEDSYFQAAANPIIEGNAKKYFQRAKKENPAVTYEECRLAAKEYLIEECAMLFVLNELNYDFGTYPGALNDALQYITDNYLKSNPMPWLEYKFKDKAPTKSIFNQAPTHCPTDLKIAKDPRSQAIILNITTYGLNEKFIRPKFLMAFSLFIATFIHQYLGNLPSMPQIKYHGEPAFYAINSDIPEKEFYETILTNVEVLKLTDEKVWFQFYAAYLLFLNDFIYNIKENEYKPEACVIL